MVQCVVWNAGALSFSLFEASTPASIRIGTVINMSVNRVASVRIARAVILTQRGRPHLRVQRGIPPGCFERRDAVRTRSRDGYATTQIAVAGDRFVSPLRIATDEATLATR